MSYVNTIGNQFQSAPFRYVASLYRYRSLCFNLVGSDLRARFRRSHLGLLWAGIQPLGFALLIASVWSVVFEQDVVGFGVYVMTGMIVWEYFSNTVIGAQDALINSEGYLKQSRIPILIFQLRTPIAGLFTYMIGLAALLLLQAVVGQLPSWGPHLLYVIAFVPVLVLFITPIACIFSILGTQFRDLRHAMSLILNAIFFMSPVIVLRKFLEVDNLALLQYANPIIPLLRLQRSPLLESTNWPTESAMIVLAWIICLWLIAITLSIFFGRRIVFAL